MKQLISVPAIILPAILSMLCFPLAVQAEEPAAEFLEVLRQKRYFDVAERYLESLATSNLAPEGFRDRIGYEHAVILIQGAALIGNPQQRVAQLDRAQTLIQKFMADFPDHVLKHSARAQLGSLLQQRANDNLAIASRPGQANRSELLTQAQGQYDRAHQVYSEAKEAIGKQLAEVNSIRYDPDKQQKEIRIREELRREYLQMQLASALLLEEAAETVKAGSDKRTDYLTRAAADFKEIYGKYRFLQAGIYAHVYEGRCLFKLGKLDDALTNFADVLRQPENDAFRDAKTRSLVLALECWLDESQKKYAEAVSRGNSYVTTMRGNEAASSEWFKLRMLVAKVNKLYADELITKDPKDELADQSYREATILLRALIKVPNNYVAQHVAREDCRRNRSGDEEAIHRATRRSTYGGQHQACGVDAVLPPGTGNGRAGYSGGCNPRHPLLPLFPAFQGQGLLQRSCDWRVPGLSLPGKPDRGAGSQDCSGLLPEAVCRGGR